MDHSSSQPGGSMLVRALSQHLVIARMLPERTNRTDQEDAIVRDAERRVAACSARCDRAVSAFLAA